MQLRKFRYLDIESVRVEAREGERIPLLGVVSALKFRSVANPETRALEGPSLDRSMKSALSSPSFH